MIIGSVELQKMRLDFYRGAVAPKNFVESTPVLVFPDDLGKRTALAFGKMRRPGLSVVLNIRVVPPTTPAPPLSRPRLRLLDD